jgi:choline dehydrogenase
MVPQVLLGAVLLALLNARVTATPVNQLRPRAPSVVTSSIQSVQGKTYTHVVVGCGLAGLVVATRLSENTTNSVLCIEAGGDTRTDPRVVSL